MYCQDINFKEKLLKTKSLHGRNTHQFGDLLDNFSRHYFFQLAMATKTVAPWSATCIFLLMFKGNVVHGFNCLPLTERVYRKKP